MIGCRDCGTLQDIPVLPPNGTALCAGCRDHLERAGGRGRLGAALALATAVFLLLLPANLFHVMRLDVDGLVLQSRLGSGIATIWQQDWVLIALCLGAFGVILPVIRFGLLAVTLAAIWLNRRGRWTGPAFRWAMALAPWAMPDVYLVGGLIGYTRLAAFVPVQVGAGGWCFVAAALLAILTNAVLDPGAVWRLIAPEGPEPEGPALSCTACNLALPADQEGHRCPRCRARLALRKPDALVRTTALVAAGTLLYPLAYIYPMSVLLSITGNERHSIFSGIQQLIQAHLWPFAVLIFCTSVAIPLLKLAGLGWCLISIKRPFRRTLVLRTWLHRFIDGIGRWSNVDVFAIAAFAPLIQVQGLASVQAAPGADAFLLVVVLTMFASRCFDPRLMWDAAEALP